MNARLAGFRVSAVVSSVPATLRPKAGKRSGSTGTAAVETPADKKSDKAAPAPKRHAVGRFLVIRAFLGRAQRLRSRRVASRARRGLSPAEIARLRPCAAHVDIPCRGSSLLR